MVEGLTKEIISKVENDLRKYPDWILRIEASGLGITSRAFKDYTTYDFKSMVENNVEFEDETKRKIVAIESVIDRRLTGTKRKIIEMRYFYDEPRWKIMKELELKDKNEYYKNRDFAILSFARAIGYIAI